MDNQARGEQKNQSGHCRAPGKDQERAGFWPWPWRWSLGTRGYSSEGSNFCRTGKVDQEAQKPHTSAGSPGLVYVIFCPKNSWDILYHLGILALILACLYRKTLLFSVWLLLLSSCLRDPVVVIKYHIKTNLGTQGFISTYRSSHCHHGGKSWQELKSGTEAKPWRGAA